MDDMFEQAEPCAEPTRSVTHRHTAPKQGTLAPIMPKVSTEPCPHSDFLTNDAKIRPFVTIVADGGPQSGMYDNSITNTFQDKASLYNLYGYENFKSNIFASAAKVFMHKENKNNSLQFFIHISVKHSARF